MYLAQLNITNFRKLQNVELHFQAGLNVLVGANNVGKSAVVDALRALLAGHDEPYSRFDVEDILRIPRHREHHSGNQVKLFTIIPESRSRSPRNSVHDASGNGVHDHRNTHTVHQAKGESLDAVLYVATKDHVRALLAGTNSEVGRIGYVAVTRAKNLLWLGVPASAINEMRPALLGKGFQEAGAVVANKV